MGLKISGYQIFTQIHESSNSQVYRGIRESDRLPIIFKVLNKTYPTPEEITRYQQEYQITYSLNINHVIKAYDLQETDNKFILFLEDFGGKSLDKLITFNNFSFRELLRIAIQITQSLGEIHAANVIHKDINPSNIVLNRKTGKLKIIDFGISTTFSREKTTFTNPTKLEGTLAYISPEQTGRINRVIDYRTDFYSLGATFYQLLTDRLPFECLDALEMVHYHLAIEPTPLYSINPKIPKPVSDIVMKLLAKMPEKRYRSSWGIKSDLEKCLNQLQTKGYIEDFALGSNDIDERFQISQKLYGRKPEVKKLLAAFDRVAESREKRSEIILVSGYGGIGKSTLVQELYQSITLKNGYFLRGKFDKYQRNIPYFAITQALEGLIQLLLTETQTRLNQWQEKILSELGSNSQAIVNLIPSLRLIISPENSIGKLSPKEAENCFNLAFEKFIKIFAKAEHPLVLFLDDLQWADRASLKLIKQLICQANERCLLLIGAYRNNEVSPTHPLMLMLDEISSAGVSADCITLSPLELSDINNLIADSLHCSPEKTISLAELLQFKTGGNPFFINEFLKTLYRDNSLYFDWKNVTWDWSLEEIQSKKITDNIVELMTSQIHKLEQPVQQILSLASCIGHQFELKILAIAAKKDLQEIALILHKAICIGLISPLNNVYKSAELGVKLSADDRVEYKFAHDRIQQAAYSLVDEREKPRLHYQIGQLLLQNITLEKQEQKIFDIVNQLNLGICSIDSRSEKKELAKLNLKAGKKAIASSAYESAFEYLQIGLSLLEEHSWKTEYNLTLDLYVTASEAAYLNTEFEAMDKSIELVLKKARSILDKVKVYQIRIKAYESQTKLQEAIETGLHCLKLLGIKLPSKPSKFGLFLDLIKIRIAFYFKRIDQLIYMPEMKDLYKIAAINIMKNILVSAHKGFPNIYGQIVFKQIKLSIESGNSYQSAFAYGIYAIILYEVWLDIDSGYRFGKLALSLSEKFNDPGIKTKINFMFNYCIKPGRHHIKETLNHFLQLAEDSRENGDLQYSAYSLSSYCYCSYIIGKQLGKVEREMALYENAIARLNQSSTLALHKMSRQMVLNLRGKSQEKCSLNGKVYNEKDMISVHLKDRDRTAIFTLYANKLILSYLFNDLSQGVENIKNAEKNLDSAMGLVLILFNFYSSLTFLALFSNSSKSKQKSTLTKVNKNQKKLKKWADAAPMNYLHKYYLVEAERHRVVGKEFQAIKYYDRAIELAKKYEYLNEEALANELAAKFYLQKGKITIARAYLQEARYCYLKWGATAKVHDLENHYGDLLQKQSAPTTSKLSVDKEISTSTSTIELDLETLMKASQTISREIVLDKLLVKLMEILIENAGAVSGYLILSHQDDLRIEAMKSFDRAEVSATGSIPLEEIENNTNPCLPLKVINYVVRTKKSAILDNAAEQEQFKEDPYIIQNQTKSVACYPLIDRGRLSGIIYLENNLNVGAFTPLHLEMLNLLGSQAVIAIDNARLLQQQKELNKSLQNEISQRQKAEERFELAVSGAGDGIWDWHIPTDEVYFSPRWKEILGYCDDEIKNEPTAFFSRLHPEDRELVDKALRDHFEKGISYKMEFRLRNKQGGYTWICGRGQAIRDEFGNIVRMAGSNTDITDRKQAEKAMRESEKKFRAIFDRAFEFIGLLKPDGTLIEANQTLLDFSGLNIEDIVGKPFWEAPWWQISLDTVEQLKQAIADAAKGEFIRYEADIIGAGDRVITIDFSLKPIADDRGQVILLIPEARDITTIKQAEAALRQRQEFLSNIYKSASEVIWVVEQLNDGEFWVISINQAVERVSGIPASYWLGKRIEELWDSKIAAKIRQDLYNCLQVDKPITYEQYLPFRGQRRYIRTTITPLPDPHKVRLLGISNDISDRKVAEQAICQLNEELEQRVQQRTAQLEATKKELESFSYSVSHDLRAPLRHINGFLQVLQKQLHADNALENPKVREYLEIIDNSGKKMEQLIEGLLRLSQIGRQELEIRTVNLPQLAERAIELVIPAAELQQGRIICKIGDLPSVKGDPALLQQVFTNLASNAVKFSRDRSLPEIEIGSLPDSTIFVKDNGVGFSMEYADRLFGAFQRLHSKKKFEGTGIGLSIVQRIIHRHGGRIWADSKPDFGATFYFQLGDL